MSVIATMAGVITMIAFWMRFSLFFGGRGRVGMGELIAIIAMSILMPLAAMVIKLAISRSREHQANATGGKLGRNPRLWPALWRSWRPGADCAP